jgi:hypothetical protein
MSRMLEVAYSRAARRQRSLYCTGWIHPNARLYWITIILLYRCANLPRSFVFVLSNKELKLQDESHLSYQSHSHHQHSAQSGSIAPSPSTLATLNTVALTGPSNQHHSQARTSMTFRTHWRVAKSGSNSQV